MEHINIIGDIDPKLWERQHLTGKQKQYHFHYRDLTRDAKWSVFIGNASKEYLPNPNSNSVFMLVEPPEIYVYKPEYLKQFKIVAGPKFPQYLDLPNYHFSQIALPWSLGVAFQDTSSDFRSRLMRNLPGRFRMLLKQDPLISFNIEELLSFSLDKEAILSVVTSDKTETPMQKTRIEFIRFLRERGVIPLEVYGRGFRPIRDKFEILSKSTHHLALENSTYPGNWTEKLSDSILAQNRTYYVGDPDIEKYFSSDSVLPIDLTDFDKAAEIIEKDFTQIEYNQSILEESRHQLVTEYSFESVITKILQTKEKNSDGLVR